MATKLRKKDGIYCATAATLTSSTHKFKEGDFIYATDTKELFIGVAGALFSALKGIRLIGIKQATVIAALGTTTNLTAIPGSFADLAAARSAVATLQSETEARLDAIEAKIDAILVVLKTANVMAST